jgi:hypothetical protein
MRKQLLIALLGMFMLSGCLRTAGQDLALGAADGLLLRDSALTAMTTSLASQIVTAARDSLITPSLNHRLTSTVDSILTHFGVGASREVTALRDSLLGSYLVDLVADIRTAAIGHDARTQIGSLREELLGRKAADQLSVLMATLIGDTTQARLAMLRSELLGPATSSRIDTIISHAIGQIAADYRDKLQPILRADGGWLQKNATTLAWTSGIIVALLLGWGAWLSRKYSKYAKMLNVITYQIHDIDDKNEYDELTERISKQAKQNGIEADLRALLKKRGLLDEPVKPEPMVQVA